MKKVSIIGLAVLALGFMFAPVAKAQNGAVAPYVTVGMSATGSGSTLASTTPSGDVSVGIESSTKHLLLDANGGFTFQNSFSTASGYTGYLKASGYLKLGNVLVGGGAFYSNQIAPGVSLETASETTLKGVNVTQIRPYIGGGYQFSHDRILVDYVLPGGFFVTGFSNYNVSDVTFNFHNEIFLTRSGFLHHLRLVQNVGISSNLTGTNNARVTTWVGGAGLKFIL